MKYYHTIKRKYVILASLGLLALFYLSIAIYSTLTNPFSKYTIVQQPFEVTFNQQGKLELIDQHPLYLKSGPLYSAFIWLKSGHHIITNVYTGEKKSHETKVDDIIRDIHTLRFNPNNHYIISGDHFSTLYPRSLGIFYHSLLDPRTALDINDWQARQVLYAKTTAFALKAYAQSDKLSTTIVPIGPNHVSLLNIYAPPSDTLYSLLYAISTLNSSDELKKTYPFTVENELPLQTQHTAQFLQETYKDTLSRHYTTYVQDVTDPRTELIKKDILLSGTKDVTMRQGAFYDNVILWKTHQLAQKLQLTSPNPQKLDALKQNILKTFWQPEMGCFLEDQSSAAVSGKYYSSEWLIVLSTGFLDPSNPEERKYYEGCISYIQQEKLDQPFGLKYQQTGRKERQYWVVRTFVPEYGANTIWSNWAQEYIKLLTRVYQVTGEKKYLETAEKQLEAYTKNIGETGCYPEVYDEQGKMFKNTFYKSVCQTGWVVSFEQAQKMVEFAKKNPPNPVIINSNFSPSTPGTSVKK